MSRHHAQLVTAPFTPLRCRRCREDMSSDFNAGFGFIGAYFLALAAVVGVLLLLWFGYWWVPALVALLKG